jgi:hypothetical protein
MDFELAERRFQELRTQHDQGELDTDTFRVEVAKLLLRGDRGAFWMLDPESGTWFRNQGEGWEPGDPRAERLPEAVGPARRETTRRRLALVLAVGAVVLAVSGTIAAMVFLRWPPSLWEAPQPAPAGVASVAVTIAAPADGSEVVLGQEVAVESTIDGALGLEAVERVELRANDLAVDTQPVQPRIRPGQTSLPLSQVWRPSSAGEVQVAVVALSAADLPLGKSTVTLNVIETSEGVLPEPACIPDATFVADVTIAAGTVFPPGARMDKVWQVRNSGTCAWGVGYELVLREGEVLGAPSSMPVLPTVAGETADLAATFVAPAEAGLYDSVWQLRSPDGSYFGPTLTLSVEVKALVVESPPPIPPSNLQAAVGDDGEVVRLTWTDQSDNEDAFRVYREDMAASIGLAPANAELFVDEQVTCGSTYRYSIVAFNASGVSASTGIAAVSMPPCAPPDLPPSLSLTVVPTRVVPSETFTITFLASDDIGLELVVIWGLDTGHQELDTGRLFTCTEVLCTAAWPVTWTETAGIEVTIAGVARDSSGQESERASVPVGILPPE